MCTYMHYMCTTHVVYYVCVCVFVTERESEPRKAPLNKVDSYESYYCYIIYTCKYVHIRP